MAIFRRKPPPPPPRKVPPDRRTEEVLHKVDDAVSNLTDALAEWRTVRDELTTRRNTTHPEEVSDHDV